MYQLRGPTYTYGADSGIRPYRSSADMNQTGFNGGPGAIGRECSSCNYNGNFRSNSEIVADNIVICNQPNKSSKYINPNFKS